MSGRIDKGMAGYVTDREVQQWRHLRKTRPLHPLRYDPPRAIDTIKTVAGLVIGGLFAWFMIELWWALWSVTQPYMW